MELYITSPISPFVDISQGILFGLMAMASWGLSDFFVVRPVREVGAFRTFLWNQVSGLPIVAVAFLLFGHASPLDPRQLLLMAAAGTCGILGSVFFYRGMRSGNVSVITPIVAAWSVVTAIGGILFLGETLSAIQAGGIILAVTGTALVSIKFKDIRGAGLSRGVGSAAAAMLFFGLQFIFLDVLSHQVDWLEALLIIRAFVVVASAAAFGIAGRENVGFPSAVYPGILLIAVFEVLGFLAYGGGIALLQSAVVAPVSATHPLVTIILAIVVLRERLEPSQAAGILSVIAGLVLLSL